MRVATKGIGPAAISISEQLLASFRAMVVARAPFTLVSCAVGLIALQAGTQTTTLIPDLRIQSDARTAAEFVIGPVSALAVSPSGDIIVAQRFGLMIFDSSGRFLRKVGRAGQGPGEFGAVRGLGWLGDSLWVFDPGNARLSLFSPRGDYRGIRSARGAASPLGSHETPRYWLRGGFAVVDRALTGNETAPVEVTLNREDGPTVRILSSVLPRQELVPMVVGTMRIRLPQPFSDSPIVVAPPSGAFVVVVDRRIELATSDSVFVVSRYRSNGEPISEIRFKSAPTRLTVRARDSILVLLARDYAQTPFGRGMPVGEFVDVARREIDTPSIYPLVSSAKAGDDGSLWLREWRDIENWIESWIVLDSAARLIHRVRVPLGTRILHVTRDQVWTAVDSVGQDAAIVRHRLTRR